MMLSYDRYNSKADRMVRVIFRGSTEGGKMNEANAMPPVASTLLRDFPEVQEATRLMWAGQTLIRSTVTKSSKKGRSPTSIQISSRSLPCR